MTAIRWHLTSNRDGRISVIGASAPQRRNLAHEQGRTVESELYGECIKNRIEWMASDGLLFDDRNGKATENINENRIFGNKGGK